MRNKHQRIDRKRFPELAIRALGVRMRLSATFSVRDGVHEWNLY